jgi:hypothetical protein
MPGLIKILFFLIPFLSFPRNLSACGGAGIHILSNRRLAPSQPALDCCSFGFSIEGEVAYWGSQQGTAFLPASGLIRNKNPLHLPSFYPAVSSANSPQGPDPRQQTQVKICKCRPCRPTPAGEKSFLLDIANPLPALGSAGHGNLIQLKPVCCTLR